MILENLSNGARFSNESHWLDCETNKQSLCYDRQRLYYTTQIILRGYLHDTTPFWMKMQ